MSSVLSFLACLSCRRRRALPYLEDDPSLNRPIGHGAHGFLDLFQRKDAIAVGADLPLGQQLRQRAVHARSLLGEFLGPGAPGGTAAGIMPLPRAVPRPRTILAASEAD